VSSALDGIKADANYNRIKDSREIKDESCDDLDVEDELYRRLLLKLHIFPREITSHSNNPTRNCLSLNSFEMIILRDNNPYGYAYRKRAYECAYNKAR